MTDISDFGFDVSLNIPGKDTGTPVVYDGIGDAVASQQISAAGNLTLKNLTLSGISKMAAPGDDLQAVINAVATSGGGTVLLKSGTYTQKTPLIGYSSVTLQGVSSSTTLISFEGSSNLSFTGTEVYTTGTITSITSAVFVTGSGTTWLSKARAGQYLFLGTRHYRIAAVTSDTTLILAEGYGDNVTFPGAAYRIATAILDVRLKDFSVTGSTGTGIEFTDAVQPDLNNVIAYSCNKGFSFTNVDRATINRTIAVANTSNGIEFTNVGLSSWGTINATFNGGHGFVLNNVKTVGGIALSASANTSDGFNLTDTDQVNLLVEASGNGGQGIEMVSGCDENEIDGLFVGNASDGIKLTLNDDRNKITGIYKSNGGYGINIADSTDDNNTIDVPTFSGNASGTYNDSGTSTNIVVTSGTLTSSRGTGTRAGNTASGNQVFAHGLGRTPKLVKFSARWAPVTGLITISDGTYDGTNTSSVSLRYTNSGSSNAYVSTTNVLEMFQSDSGDSQKATVSFDATNVTLAWTLAGGPNNGNMNIAWEALLI